MDLQINTLQLKDIEKANEIVEENKIFLKESGIDQWQNGYPDRASLLNDINENNLYGLWIDNNLGGIFYISDEKDLYYNDIEGSWLSDDRYIVVHRVAISSKYRGKKLSKVIFQFVFEETKRRNIEYVRIDTHKDNFIMNGLVKSLGFMQCGLINVRDGARIAYEINLKEQ